MGTIDGEPKLDRKSPKAKEETTVSADSDISPRLRASKAVADTTVTDTATKNQVLHGNGHDGYDQVQQHHLKLYRLKFAQANNVDHQALALVSSTSSTQSEDRFDATIFHVVGLIALGMEYKCAKSRDFRKEKGFYERTLIGVITIDHATDVTAVDGKLRHAVDARARIDAVCRDVKPPSDERLLFRSRVQIEKELVDLDISSGDNKRDGRIRDCSVWIDEVVEELIAREILVKSLNRETGDEHEDNTRRDVLS